MSLLDEKQLSELKCRVCNETCITLIVCSIHKGLECLEHFDDKKQDISVVRAKVSKWFPNEKGIWKHWWQVRKETRK
jgi:hypothetical protein